MLYEWGEKIGCNTSHSFKVLAVNDLEKSWRGQIRIRILRGDREIIQKSVKASIPAYGQISINIPCQTPAQPGQYTVEVTLSARTKKPIRSIRELSFVDE